MVRAILDGRKTMTRRVVKVYSGDGAVVLNGNMSEHTLGKLKCPYGQVGDRLWVRETWRVMRKWDDTPPRSIPDNQTVEYCADDYRGFFNGKTRVSIHMPRWACRIQLEVTGVRIERLQDISEGDAIAEGLVTMPQFDWTTQKPTGRILAETTQSPPYWDTPKTAFQTLWESINGPGSWAANPFVWVIEFKRIKP
jgi:hypothetical protein